MNLAHRQIVKERLNESSTVKLELQQQAETISDISRVLIQVYRKGGKVILFGNGGSAADAQHIAAEFMGKYYLERAPLPALALTVNTSALTAIGNDYSFAEVFSRQVLALGDKGDAAIGISTSGNSENVIQALKVARERGLTTIGFTGRGGGKLRDIVDHCLLVPSDNTPRIQEGHITAGHIICEIVEEELFGKARAVGEKD